MIDLGMSVARLNLAHGDKDFHRQLCSTVRDVSAKLETNTSILADVPGPKYRLGHIRENVVSLQDEAEIVLTDEIVDGVATKVTVQPGGIWRDVKPGARVTVNEGVVGLEVAEVGNGWLRCVVREGGVIASRKAVNTPGATSTLDYFTEETVAALELAAELRVDFVGLSYVRNVEDVRRVKKYLLQRDFSPRLIAKIELRDAVNNIDEILAESDAVMVARGDLGIEMPLPEMPATQRRIVLAGNRLGKPVITATQMLESMIELPHPTRAEVTDVHNAIRDGSDAIMLSGETSVGKYPLAALGFMVDIARRAEEQTDYQALGRRRIIEQAAVDDTIASSVATVARELKVKAIVAFTESGTTVKRVASFRPMAPIIGVVRNATNIRDLSLVWGVDAIAGVPCKTVQEMFVVGSKIAIQRGYAQAGDLIIAVVGMPIGLPGNTNLLRVIRVPED